jgi:hypothetical protein
MAQSYELGIFSRRTRESPPRFLFTPFRFARLVLHGDTDIEPNVPAGTFVVALMYVCMYVGFGMYNPG